MHRTLISYVLGEEEKKKHVLIKTIMPAWVRRGQAKWNSE